MSVYVDQTFSWPVGLTAKAAQGVAKRNHGQWCHLWADSSEELHAFASRIGLRREWCQYPGTPKEHYDLTPAKRAAALRAGAVESARRGDDSKRAQLQTLCNVPGIMTGQELAKAIEDQGQLLLFDSANRPRVFGDRKGKRKERHGRLQNPSHPGHV